MKKRILSMSIIFLMLISVFMLNSCEEITDLVAFNVEKEMPAQHFNLDSASTVKGETVLYESYLDINLDSILEANGFDAGKISEGKFKSILLSIENPTPKMQMGFVSDLTIKLSETEGFENEQIFATAQNIQLGDTEVNFDINDEEMDYYLSVSKFYFRVYGTMLSPVPVDKLPLILNSTVGFRVSPLE